MKPVFLSTAAALMCVACVITPKTPKDDFAAILSQQVSACWSPPATAAQLSYRPRVRVLLRTDGALEHPPVLLNPSSVPAETALAAGAVAALRSCSPFKIPSDMVASHPDWREIRITFDARSLQP
jgi:hypothetical protein